MKTKVKYISISNILHLLSATVPIPHAKPILTNHPHLSVFLLAAIISLIVVL